jgi:hypothetical protein
MQIPGTITLNIEYEYSKEDFRRLIASWPDHYNARLMILADGTIMYVDFRDRQDSFKKIATYSSGLGYKGPEAARDPKFLEQIMAFIDDDRRRFLSRRIRF